MDRTLECYTQDDAAKTTREGDSRMSAMFNEREATHE